MSLPAATAFVLRLVRHLRWRWSKLVEVPRIIFRRHGSRIWNDHVLARYRRVSTGRSPLGDRVVIYVIFAPQGILPSHISALSCIAAAEYSPVVVANGGATDVDREKLLHHCAILLERANFGYDFGAFRDGIRLLDSLLARPSRLVLANDSVWFPLPGRLDWFAQAEGVPADCVGASSNLGVIPETLANWPAQQWKYDQSLPDYHLCSFLLSFRRKVLLSDEFAKFWATLPLSNNKFWVVTKNELGLSKAMRAAGFTLGTTTPLNDLVSRLEMLSDVRLKQLLERLIIPEDPILCAERDKVLTSFESTERRRIEAFILHAVAATGPAYALADLAVGELGQPFLKKTPLLKCASSATASLAILQDLGAVSLLIEARAMLTQRGT
jgi:hypothetical protein